MPTVTFYGASDDLVEVDGDVPGCDEYCAPAAAFEVAGLRVGVEYHEASGTWEIGVGLISENTEVVAQDVRLDSDGYTMRLTLYVPPGSYVPRAARVTV